jgi:hypothetical protein
VELVIRTVERPERIGPEIEEAKRDGVEALNVLASPLLYTRRLDIFERAEALRVPTIYQSPEFAEEGGLIGYGRYLTQMFRQLARQLAKVLRGEKVSDLPVEQPTSAIIALSNGHCSCGPFPALALLLHGGLARNHGELCRRPLERLPSQCAAVQIGGHHLVDQGSRRIVRRNHPMQ